MDGLKSKKYLHTSRKRFDPLALACSIAGLAVVVYMVAGHRRVDTLFDLRSVFIVVGGTFLTLLFQFDFSGLFNGILLTAKSFFGTPEKKLLDIHKKLDGAILQGTSLCDLSDGHEINGDLINDVVHMHNKGLLFEEIDAFVTSKIEEDFFRRQTTVTILNRGALVAPALGLFGTVIGLIGVLNSLTNPSEIGPSMSLALMTTAYGAGMGSLVFTPLAGRLEHHNSVHLEFYRQILSKISVLLNREDRRMDTAVALEDKKSA